MGDDTPQPKKAKTDDGAAPGMRCLWWSGRVNNVGHRCTAPGTEKIKGGWVCRDHMCTDKCGRKARPGVAKCDECGRVGSKKAAKR